MRCPDCREELFVAFSCKDRGFCPSCTARRAAETAANLVDQVLPRVALRQWVLALPMDLHVRAARDPALEAALLDLFVRELTRLLQEITGAGRAGRGGSVAFLQHFGSTLNLHVHFHVLAVDGVYVPGESDHGPPKFVRAPAPTRDQVERLCERVATRARRLVDRRPGHEPEEEATLPVLKLVGAEPAEPVEPRLHARVEGPSAPLRTGFDLHASRPFKAEERVGVERFCRYALRGPIVSGRLSQGPRGLLIYRLKTPKPDGTTELALTPMALLQRMARLIPRPRVHMVRYFGVLAPAAEWRRQVIPAPPEDDRAERLLRRKGARYIDWANLLRRVFLLEILVCGCGGTRRVIASIEEGSTARKILQHLGLPDEPPRLEPARLEQPQLWPTGPPQDEAEPAPPVEWDQRQPDDDVFSL